jgi:hypothetical protein
MAYELKKECQNKHTNRKLPAPMPNEYSVHSPVKTLRVCLRGSENSSYSTIYARHEELLFQIKNHQSDVTVFPFQESESLENLVTSSRSQKRLKCIS